MGLDLVDLAAVLGLVAIAFFVAVWQRLGVAGNFVVATFRAVLQLVILGYVLQAVFQWGDPIVVLVAIAVMLLTTTLITRNRISQKLPRLLLIVGGTLLINVAFMLAYTQLFILPSEVRYSPQYLIPIAGILLGSGMSAAAIAGERFVSLLSTSQLEIETHLSLGATPAQAIAQYRTESIKAGLLPTLNTMLIVGMVNIPSFMSGQLIAGVSPVQAALFQIIILLLTAIAALLTPLLLLAGISRQFFNQAAQLVLY